MKNDREARSGQEAKTSTEFYARSGDRSKGIPPQTYRDHIVGVVERVRRNLDRILRYSRRTPDWNAKFRFGVEEAAREHDLGKLDPENQRVLAAWNPRAPLAFRHEEAGILDLLERFPGDYPFSAILVGAHHRGLGDLLDERSRDAWRFRVYDSDSADEGRTVERRLNDYRETRRALVGDLEPDGTARPLNERRVVGLTYRLGLSCLVDADYGDAAASRGEEEPELLAPPRWGERLERLIRYVDGLGDGSPRSADRADAFRACLEKSVDVAKPTEICSSPVGTGKTTAVMARLLRLADELDLRRIFVVLPFTNIIDRSVDVYRRALTLPGEEPEEIVAAQHHLVEYTTPDLRSIAAGWKAPIVATTAAQFFETLGSCSPKRLRKLCELPGSAVFIDEAHAAAPLALWPQEWRWFDELAEKWSCRFIFGSGSLRRFWRFPDFLGTKGSAEGEGALPEEILPDDLRARLERRERTRVRFELVDGGAKALELDELAERLLADANGSKLVILNAVYTAASLASKLRGLGADVLHLSTALAPRDRAPILKEIAARLNRRSPAFRENWILVATSCVEAGVDFSFAKGFRECCSATSLLQTAGRVDRNFEFGENAPVVSFRLLESLDVSDCPAFRVSRDVLDELFRERWFEPGKTLDDLLDEELRRTLERTDVRTARDALCDAERNGAFKRVDELCRLIETPTSTVVVDDELVERLENREKVDYREIQQKSVPIWTTKTREYGIEEIRGYDGLGRWTLEYDPNFLGYAAGAIPIIRAAKSGEAFFC